MLTKLTETEATVEMPVDEWQCQECATPLGWTLLNERSIDFVECWYLTGKDPLDPAFPKWCDTHVVPSPFPWHRQGKTA